MTEGRSNPDLNFSDIPEHFDIEYSADEEIRQYTKLKIMLNIASESKTLEKHQQEELAWLINLFSGKIDTTLQAMLIGYVGRIAGIKQESLVKVFIDSDDHASVSIIGKIYSIDIEKFAEIVQENDFRELVNKLCEMIDYDVLLKETLESYKSILEANNVRDIIDCLSVLVKTDYALVFLDQLEKLFGVVIDNFVTSVIRRGSRVLRCYVNSPHSGIYQFSIRKKKDDIDDVIDYIMDFYILACTIHMNPIDKTYLTYDIILYNPFTYNKLVYKDSELSAIVNDLKNKHGIGNSQRLNDALSKLISEFIIRGLAKKTIRVPATGFFKVNGKIEYFESPRFPVELPREYSAKDVIEAFKALEDLLSFYDFSDKALANLYYAVQAPLGFIAKQNGRENKVLINYGEPHVGKTLLCKILGYIWGVREDMSVVSASKITAPQLAERFSETTFLITLDEAKNVLIDPHLSDMIKSSTTGTHIKSRIIPSLGYRRREFYAYASIIMTTNYIDPQLNPGILERLIPVEWTVEDKRDDLSVKEFLAKINKYRKRLAFIGAFLRDFFLKKSDVVEEIVSKYDQITAGKKILELALEELGYKPEWLRDIKLSFDIEIADEVEVFLDALREEIIDAMKKGSIAGEMFDGWSDILKELARKKVLPSYLTVTPRNLIIRASIKSIIRKRYGFEITSLKNIALKLRARCSCKYTPYKGKKVLMIPLDYIDELLSREQIDDELIADSSKKGGKYLEVLKIIKELQDKHKDGVPLEKILEKAREKMIDESFVYDVLEHAKKTGEVAQVSHDKYLLIY